MSTVTDEVLAVGREALAAVSEVADGAHVRVLGDVFARLEKAIAAIEAERDAAHAPPVGTTEPAEPAPPPPPADVSGLEARLAATDSASPPAG